MPRVWSFCGFLGRKGTILGFTSYIKCSFWLTDLSDPCASVSAAGSWSRQHWEGAGSTGMNWCALGVVLSAAASGGFSPRVIWKSIIPLTEAEEWASSGQRGCFSGLLSPSLACKLCMEVSVLWRAERAGEQWVLKVTACTPEKDIVQPEQSQTVPSIPSKPWPGEITLELTGA